MCDVDKVIQIDELPDDVLLEIFDFYMGVNPYYNTDVEAWQSLVHVCRRWRSLVFGSASRLNLRLICTPETPARDILDVWPAFPILIRGNTFFTSGVDDVIVALEQNNRVCEVSLSGLANRQLQEILVAMQVPFPELTQLRLFSGGGTLPVVPDSFLGGSAPQLLFFQLDGIQFPGLPKLLSSATHLVCLYLPDIPDSAYISPKAMAALLSVLSSLEELFLGFQPQLHLDWEGRPPPPPKRSAIRTLTHFIFKGFNKYLEDLVAFIDAPKLDRLFITSYSQIYFDGPQLAQFISRTPILEGCGAEVKFDDSFARVGLNFSSKHFEIGNSCGDPNGQFSFVAQVCNSCLPPLSTIEVLYIEHRYRKNDSIKNTLWLELLHSFPAVKNLYLSKDFAPGIVAALKEVVGTEVLPSLQNIFVQALEPSGPFQEIFGQFIAARESSGHSITISVWDGY